ncbi:MAG: GDSL-type esterase/lipase family protein [Marinovum sp.]|nr:GDSL-type esterase/lipase family protein [Marinovum sp.]
MQSVLCFGDSLTWGHDPATGGRHAYEDRWPTVLTEGLPGVNVIAEGLRGRSTCRDNGSAPCDYNGARALPMILHTHAPIDVVVIMLGLNDIWQGWRPDQVGAGLKRLVEIVRTHPYRVDAPAPDVLLVSQPPLVAGNDPTVTGPLIAASRRLEVVTRIAAQEFGRVPTVDMRGIAEASPLDCVHLDAENTRKMGAALVAPVKAMLEARE